MDESLSPMSEPRDSPAAPGGRGARPTLWRPLSLLVVIGGLIVATSMLDLGRHFEAVRGWVESAGPLGPVVFMLVYIAATVLAFPGSPLTIVAGALFGSALGVAVVSAASTAGAALSFLLARHLARDAVAGWLSENPSFRRLDRMTERHGVLLVALTRLVPLFPFSLLNYGLGLTRVRFWTYVLWSWICMLPATVLFVVGGDAIMAALAEGRVAWSLLAVLAGAGLLLVLLTYHARRWIRTLERSAGDPSVGGPRRSKEE